MLEHPRPFYEFIGTKRVLIKNRTDIFGEQLMLDENDEVIGSEEHLLPNATLISLDEAPEIVKDFGGICFPAHIDRDANGIVAILGTVPSSPDFRCVEMHDADKISEYKEKYGLSDKVIVVNSDSHYLTDINETNTFFELEADPDSPEEVRRELFKLLK